MIVKGLIMILAYKSMYCKHVVQVQILRDSIRSGPSYSTRTVLFRPLPLTPVGESTSSAGFASRDECHTIPSDGVFWILVDLALNGCITVAREIKFSSPFCGDDSAIDSVLETGSTRLDTLDILIPYQPVLIRC